MAWTTPQKNRGYSGPGREKVTQLENIDEVAKLRQATPDLKESFEMGRENEPGYPNVWPEETDPIPAGFRTAMIDWFLQCQAFNVEVMRAIAVGMDLGESYFDPFVDVGDNTLRLLHYPAVSRESFKTNPGQERAGAHTDYGTITLLFQDTHGGLQVESPNGQYVDVPPIEGTVVINVADLLARWSNDVLKSTMHRVVEPTLAEGEVEGDTYPARYVIAYVSSFSSLISQSEDHITQFCIEQTLCLSLSLSLCVCVLARYLLDTEIYVQILRQPKLHPQHRSHSRHVCV